MSDETKTTETPEATTTPAEEQKPKQKRRSAKKQTAKAAAPAASEVNELDELKKMVQKLLGNQEQMQTHLEAKEVELMEYREEIVNLKAGLDEREAEGEVIERDGDILYDPYDSQDPFAILGSIPASDEFPEGRVLGWKSPVYREKRGWRGWFPVEHGDEIAGENDQFLANYIPDPPERMKGPDAIDKYVRRGDMVLSWIDARIWSSRQKKRELLARKRQIQAGSSQSQNLRDGVDIVGEGYTKAKRPRKEFKIPAPVGSKSVVVGERVEFPVTRKPNKE